MKHASQMTKKILNPTAEIRDLTRFPVVGILFKGKVQPLGAYVEFENIHLCQTLGIARGNLTGYTCPRCKKNEGYIAPDGHASLFFCLSPDCLTDDAECSKSVAREDRMQKDLGEVAKKDLENREKMIAAFGALYQGAALGNIHSVGPKQMDEVKKWCDSGDRFIVFAGRPGCGKTYFCAAVYYWLINKTKKLMHLPIRQYIYSLQQAINDNISYVSLIDKYKRIHFLIIDDIGANTSSEWQKEVILELIDYRYEFRLPTLITTNLKYEEMEKKMDERITSRIYDKKNLLIQDWTSNYRK